MKVHLRNPKRAIEVVGPMKVHALLEHRSPGSKHAFLFGFFERAHEPFAGVADDEREALNACEECGAPTPGDRCAFCRLRERATGSVGDGTAPVTLRRAVGS